MFQTPNYEIIKILRCWKKNVLCLLNKLQSYFCKYVFSLIYIFSQSPKDGERERHLTWRQNVNANATKVSPQNHNLWDEQNVNLLQIYHLAAVMQIKQPVWAKLMGNVAAAQCSDKETREKWIHFLFRLKVSVQAAWWKHSSYSAPLLLSALILSCCQSQKPSRAERRAHGQTYKRGLKRWTYLTDWLVPLSSFPRSLCSIHSCSSSNTWRRRRDSRGFLLCDISVSLNSSFTSIMTNSLFVVCLVSEINSFLNCNSASTQTISSKQKKFQ